MWRRVGLMLIVLSASVFGHWAFFQWREVVPGVIARPLGACDVEYYAEWHATVLACPHTDLIKLWPLPVEQPWYEDPYIDKRTVEHDRVPLNVQA